MAKPQAIPRQSLWCTPAICLPFSSTRPNRTRWGRLQWLSSLSSVEGSTTGSAAHLVRWLWNLRAEPSLGTRAALVYSGLPVQSGVAQLTVRQHNKNNFQRSEEQTSELQSLQSIS